MKKRIYIYIITVALSFASCSTSFLEIDPIGSLTGDKIFKDVDGYSAAMTGAYSLFAKYHLGNYGLYGELRADNVVLNQTLGGTLVAEYNYESTADNQTGAVTTIWSDIYETLNNVNNVIEARESLLEQFSTQRELINTLYGEALVLRAICHFDLANIYSQHYTYTADGSHLGIVVLQKTPFPGTSVSRATIKDTYQQIIVDLTEAKDILNTTSAQSKIYASADAADALLSRVYLYMEQWDNVIEKALPLVNINKYALVSSSEYFDMFVNPDQRTNFSSISSEVIWQLNLSSNSSTYLTYRLSDGNNYVLNPSVDFMALFEAEDARRSLFGEISRLPGQYITLKYGRTAATASEMWPVNFKMIRSAELYLNLAEAYFHKAQYDLAVQNLKIVRARAYGSSPAELEIVYSTPAELLQQIKLERRKELAFENQRVFDIMRYKENLVRTGVDCASVTCNLTYPNEKFVLPIPQLEIDANPTIQPNPGVNN